MILGRILERRIPILDENYDWFDQREKAAKRQAKEEYQNALSRYNRAIERWWNDLYYCSRDDGVFTRGSQLVPVEQMRTLLYA
jgi:hypothetical protein